MNIMSENSNPFSNRNSNKSDLISQILGGFTSHQFKGANPSSEKGGPSIRMMQLGADGKLKPIDSTDDNPELNGVIEGIKKALIDSGFEVAGFEDGLSFKKTDQTDKNSPAENLQSENDFLQALSKAFEAPTPRSAAPSAPSAHSIPALTEEVGDKLLKEVEGIFDENGASASGLNTFKEAFGNMVLIQASVIRTVTESIRNPDFDEKKLLASLLNAGIEAGVSYMASTMPAEQSRLKLDALAVKYGVPIWVVKAAYARVGTIDFMNPEIRSQKLKKFMSYLDSI